MSKAAAEQALTGLIPTHNGPFPAELVDLAVSLLACSRSVASSLKPDEEIARPYACAQLACERLKKRLNLPTITSRPPCPPRVYKKLYTYLESALPAPVTRSVPSTPRKNAQAPASARTTPKTAKTPLSNRKTPISKRKTPRSRAKESHNEEELPEWTMPTIRALLKTFSYPMAAPHVFTGVESIYPLLARMSAAAAPETPSKRPRRAGLATPAPAAEVSDSRTLGLIAVILFYVLSRMMDQEITPDQFLEWRDKAVSTMLDSEAGEDCTEEYILAEIEQLMPMAQEEGWLRMEWFLNIFPENDGDEMEGVELAEGGNVSKGRKTLKDSFGSEYIGLGTMMQDATDYLGGRRQEDYKSWKSGILARIEQIEASRF